MHDDAADMAVYDSVALVVEVTGEYANPLGLSGKTLHEGLRARIACRRVAS